MYALAEYYNSLPNLRLSRAVTGTAMLFAALAVITLIAGAALMNAPMLAISGVFAIATGTSLHTAMIQNHSRADAQVN